MAYILTLFQQECKEIEEEIANQQKKNCKKKNRRTANEIEKNFVVIDA